MPETIFNFKLKKTRLKLQQILIFFKCIDPLALLAIHALDSTRDRNNQYDCYIVFSALSARFQYILYGEFTMSHKKIPYKIHYTRAECSQIRYQVVYTKHGSGVKNSMVLFSQKIF